MADADARAHQIELTVQPADLDDLGHVNNVVYLRWIEDVARAHADRLGMGVNEMRSLGVVPVVRRHTITYTGAALLGDLLAVSTRITAAHGIRATRHNEVRRRSDDALLVSCETEWVWVNPESGRPRVPPAALFEHFGVTPT